MVAASHVLMVCRNNLSQFPDHVSAENVIEHRLQEGIGQQNQFQFVPVPEENA